MLNLHDIIQKISRALPQTQCTQCGFAGCLPYAQAIAHDDMPINQCPPGGQAGIIKLAQITGKPVIPLNPLNGTEQPRREASIIESECIGCTKCIQACPVDAIIGTSKRMHFILTDQCTGCELCVPPCPVDCIKMAQAKQPTWSDFDAQQARKRFEARQDRLSREHVRHKKPAHTPKSSPVIEQKNDLIEAALARARARRSLSNEG